ncbi:extracellular solute-binding protein [candidate division KSB1 bacterium]|nr:extracellular solute-binding protein [candidate division KSB1 bacterium]
MRFKIPFIAALFYLVCCVNCSDDKNANLRVAHIYDPLTGVSGKANAAWLEKLKNEFETTHPGCQVILEQIQWDQIDTKSLADFRANIIHDVIWSSPQLMPKHFLTGDLLNLSPYLQWSEQEKSEFNWNPVWEKSERDGKRLGIPLGVHTRTVAFRRDMFIEAGLNPDEPPRNPEELIQAAKALTRDIDGDGKTDIWGLGIYFGPYRATIEISFAPLLWHFSGKLWDDQTRRACFASDAGVMAAQYIHDLIFLHKVTPKWVVSGTYDDVILRNFLDGKFAMAWGWGSYWIQALEEKGWIKGVFPPTEQGEADIADVFITPTAGNTQFTNAWTISIHALSPNPKRSFEFIQAILQPEALRQFPDAGLPARKSAWLQPEYQTDFYQTWYRAAIYGKSMPFTANYMDLADAVAAALQEILANDQPVRDTLEKFQEEYNRRFAGE